MGFAAACGSTSDKPEAEDIESESTTAGTDSTGSGTADLAPGDQRQRPVLELAGGVALGVDIGDFL